MSDTIRMSITLPASPAAIHKAWLDAEEHSAFTGALAAVEPGIGGRFTAWDGYISGTTVEVDPGKRIVQRWRTTEFPEGSPDSIVEITFEAVEGGTRVSLDHREIPDGQGPSYEKGWEDFYFKPMREYFRAKGGKRPGQRAGL
jgi:uncharacterized protein YndB with AHSA1/START domain